MMCRFENREGVRFIPRPYGLSNEQEGRLAPKFWLAFTVSAFLFGSPLWAQIPALKIAIGVTPDGSMAPEWAKAIDDRNSQADMARFSKEKRPLSNSEQAWLNLIEKEVETWQQSVARLALPFPKVKPPKSVTILVGNRGGDDGFTVGSNIIGIDAQALVENYGSASLGDNRERLRRLLSHEYTHLLHKAWLDQNPVALKTPLARALWECLYEGIGNYRSASEKWASDRGELTELARKTLAELSPLFVARLEKLVSANEAEEQQLRKDLSRGPFQKKWGALPVALWSAQEAQGDDAKLAKWIDQGPVAVLELARKYLPLEQRRRIEKISSFDK